MGKGAAQALSEVEAIRAQLEQDVADLEERLPAASRWTKRAVGVAVGGGVGMKLIRIVLRRRARKKAKEHGTPIVHQDGQFSTKVAWAAAGAGLGAAAVALSGRAGEGAPAR
jgi:hypothetical protein